MINFKQVSFLKSAAQLTDLPLDEGAEVAFAGRSNAGKSTALNTLTGQHNLAKTSKTPGCTQLINLFTIQGNQRLVDLPGYGYAKVPQAIKRRWQDTLADYLRTRECLKGLILLSDIRHPLNPYDVSMLDWASEINLPLVLVLTKADKLGFGAAKQQALAVKNAVTNYDNLKEVLIFSAHSGAGLNELRSALSGLLSL